MKNTYLNNRSNLLVGVGIENLFIVQTDDATFVANKYKSQEIKNIVNTLIFKREIIIRNVQEGQSSLQIE